MFDLCNYPAAVMLGKVPTDVIDIVTHLSLYKLRYLRDWLWSGWQEVVGTWGHLLNIFLYRPTIFLFSLLVSAWPWHYATTPLCLHVMLQGELHLLLASVARVHNSNYAMVTVL